MIRLITDTEQLSLTFDESTILYRRLSQDERMKIIRSHTDSKGETDWNAVYWSKLEHCVTGWRGLDGDPKLTPENLRRLPGEVLAAIFAAIESSGAATGNPEGPPAASASGASGG